MSAVTGCCRTRNLFPGIEGWSGDAIQLSAVQREGDPLRFIIRNNSLSGAIRLTGLPKSSHSVITGNIDLKTLEPIETVNLAQEPVAKLTHRKRGRLRMSRRSSET